MNIKLPKRRGPEDLCNGRLSKLSKSKQWCPAGLLPEAAAVPGDLPGRLESYLCIMSVEDVNLMREITSIQDHEV